MVRPRPNREVAGLCETVFRYDTGNDAQQRILERNAGDVDVAIKFSYRGSLFSTVSLSWLNLKCSLANVVM